MAMAESGEHEAQTALLPQVFVYIQGIWFWFLVGFNLFELRQTSANSLLHYGM